MSNYLIDFKFKSPPKSITYIEGEPLKLTENFDFFHNKSKIRKSLNPLQYLFKSYMNNPLLASGIRDSYLSETFTEEYLIILFTTPETIKNANDIIALHSEIEIGQENFFIETTKDYLLLLAKDLNAIKAGVDYLEEIFKQVLEDYFNKKNFGDYVKIRQFKLSNF
ncbi:MAG: hypothetical protein ACFFBE_13740 [Promethearchaeota archaeon]